MVHVCRPILSLSIQTLSLLTMLSVLAAHLISTVLECIMYGIFLVLSVASLALLLHIHQANLPRPPGGRSRGWKQVPTFIWTLRRAPLVIATILLICTVTAVCSSLTFLLCQR